MKTFKIFILIPILACTACLSCDSFTETDVPQSQLTGTAVFEDAKTATAAMSNCYGMMRNNGLFSGGTEGMSSLLANYADELTYYGASDNPTQDFYSHTIVATDGNVSTWWNTAYSIIYNANVVLQGVRNSNKITGEQRSRLLAEALFTRAFVHFYLVNLFGDVPYITGTDYRTNTTAARMPSPQVYEKILHDLLESAALMPETYSGTPRIRPNKMAVYAFMARVFLYMENWEQAELQASAVINSGAYALDSPENTFLKGSTATIWQLHPGIAGTNTIEARTFVLFEAPPLSSALSQQLFEAFEPGDTRKGQWLGNVTDGTNTYYFPYKYKLTSNTAASQEHAIMLRLAEIYLIRAEARAHRGDLTGAQEDLDAVRNNAGLGNTTATTEEGLLNAIMHERRVELFTEFGHRWFDLKRTGKAAQVLSAIKPAWSGTDVLFPIPESELLVNPMLQPQNPGY